MGTCVCGGSVGRSVARHSVLCVCGCAGMWAPGHGGEGTRRWRGGVSGAMGGPHSWSCPVVSWAEWQGLHPYERRTAALG